jgi:hypothetical protein
MCRRSGLDLLSIEARCVWLTLPTVATRSAVFRKRQVGWLDLGYGAVPSLSHGFVVNAPQSRLESR